MPANPSANNLNGNALSPPSRSRSRSPSGSALPKKSNIPTVATETNQTAEKSYLTASPHLSRRSMSPSPRRLVDMRKKQNAIEIPPAPVTTNGNNTTIPLSPQYENGATMVSEAKIELQTNGNQPNGNNNTNNLNNGADAYEKISDNGSEVSDEGYRSLGLVQSNINALKRISLHSQASNEDADTNGKKIVTTFFIRFLIILLNFIQTGRLTSPDLTVQTSDDEKTVSTLPEISKEESPISDVVDTIKEPNNQFAKNGIFINEDEITVDIASTTGLRKTGFSENLYEDGPLINPVTRKNVAVSKIPKSPMLQRRKSIDNSNVLSETESNQLSRKMPAYRSVRKMSQSPSKEILRDLSKESNNTWNGRSLEKAKKRPSMQNDTFNSPSSRSSSLHRNSPGRNLQNSNSKLRNGKGTSTSVNTSPIKVANNKEQSLLAQQLLEAANKAKNDAQILEKVKQILSNYSTKNGNNRDYEDFTTAWVNSNGNLDGPSNGNSSSSPKSQSKRSSTISSADSCSGNNNNVKEAVVSPRRIDKGLSKIPAPVRSHTGLY